MRTIALLAALALTACGPSAQPDATASASPDATASPAAQDAGRRATALTANGYGGLSIGMQQAEVVALFGADANPNAVGGPDEEQCNEFHPQNAPEGMRVMIVDGKLARITLGEGSGLHTDQGFGVGAMAAAVKEAYGARAQASPHKYQDPPAEYITVWEGGPRTEDYVQDDAARGIVYEIDGAGKVGAIHAGGPPIQYVEGCA